MRACKEANGLPNETELSEGFPHSWERQELRFDQWTVVNPETGCNNDGFDVTRNVKRQCMQCLEPTCVSVCPVGALTKSETGPILYNADRCIGCRYCIMACPFDIPKFEWNSGLSPVVGKCQLCTRTRLVEGRVPACVESCPTGALKFGRRETLLFEAHSRVKSRPDRYVNHIYGEKEAGGTAWLYLSDVPFENLGFKSDQYYLGIDKKWSDRLQLRGGLQYILIWPEGDFNNWTPFPFLPIIKLDEQNMEMEYDEIDLAIITGGFSYFIGNIELSYAIGQYIPVETKEKKKAGAGGGGGGGTSDRDNDGRDITLEDLEKLWDKIRSSPGGTLQVLQVKWRF